MIMFPLGASRDLQFICQILAMAVVPALCSTSTTTWEEKMLLSLSGVSVPSILLLCISLVFLHLGECQSKEAFLHGESRIIEDSISIPGWMVVFLALLIKAWGLKDD